MAFIVEDGTIVEDANSLVSEDFADAYFEDRGITAWDDVEDKEGALVRGTAYVLGKYYGRWGGQRTEGADQPLDWPRTLAYTRDGFLIADDVIPIPLKQAISEAALREGTSPGSLTPDQVTTQQVKRVKKKVGPLETETEYADAQGETTRPDVTMIDELLAPLLYTGGTSSRVGFLARA